MGATVSACTTINCLGPLDWRNRKAHRQVPNATMAGRHRPQAPGYPGMDASPAYQDGLGVGLLS